MGTLVFQANLGGAVNLVGPNTASTVNFTLPSADGSSGQALVTNGSGTLSFSSFVSAAAGSNTQVQFNSSGAFAGSANLTFNGTTLTAANTSVTTSETLSYGTANGVAYLNGSKVITTGTALTFDGTNLGVNSPILAARTLSVKGRAAFTATANDSQLAIYSDGSTNGLYSTYNSTGSYLPMTFWINDAEQMRLTSTGLGIGTSSPSYRLQVDGASTAGFVTSIVAKNPSTNAASAVKIGFDAGGTIWGEIGASYNSNDPYMAFFVRAGSEKMRLTDSGNLGLGVTPSAWGTYKALQVGSGASVWAGGSGNAYFGSNYYFDGSTRRYINSAEAGQYAITNGVHSWFTAPSGTAGNAITFTQAMTLDASGNLQLGRTSVIGTNNRLAIQMSGTSASSYTAASNAAFAIDAGTATNSVINLVGGGDMGIFHSNSSNAYDVGISFGDNSNRILSFTTANAERARIDSSGRVLVNNTAVISGRDERLQVTGLAGSYGAIATYMNASTSQDHINFINSNGSVGKIQTSGSATTYATSSDYRLKNTIAPMTGALAKVAALKPVTYKWNADDSDGEGFIAHELAEVVPQCVTGEKDAVDAEGNPVYQGIDTSFLVATLTAAIQELKAEFDAYKATHP